MNEARLMEFPVPHKMIDNFEVLMEDFGFEATSTKEDDSHTIYKIEMTYDEYRIFTAAVYN